MHVLCTYVFSCLKFLINIIIVVVVNDVPFLPFPVQLHLGMCLCIYRKKPDLDPRFIHEAAKHPSIPALSLRVRKFPYLEQILFCVPAPHQTSLCLSLIQETRSEFSCLCMDIVGGRSEEIYNMEMDVFFLFCPSVYGSTHEKNP